MTPAQKGQLIAAIITFVVAVCNVFGINIPLLPTV